MIPEKAHRPAEVPIEAVALARTLYGQLERLDPSYETRLWDDLCGSEQDVYIYAIWDTFKLSRDEALKLLTCNNTVSRSS